MNVPITRFLEESAAVWKNMNPSAIPGTLPSTEVLTVLLQNSRRVLDIGCADGRLIATCTTSRGTSWLGVDVNEKAIERAIARNVANTEFLVQDFTVPWQGARDFDLVILNGILTCVPSEHQRAAILCNAGMAISGSQGHIYLADFLQSWTDPMHAERYRNGIAKGLEPGTFAVEGDAGELLYIARHFANDELFRSISCAGLAVRKFEVSQGVTRSGKPILTFIAVIQ